MTPTPALELEAPSSADAPPELPAAAPMSPYGVRNRKLPNQLKEAILAAFKDAQSQEKYTRRQEILEDSQHRFYDMGIQHIYQDKGYCWTQATAGATYQTKDGEDSFPDYIGDYNIFTGYALIIQAKISEPDTGIDFQPINPDSSDDRESATAAEAIRQQVDIDNDIKEVIQEVVYHVEMGGRAIAWTRTEDELAVFGVNPNGSPRRKTCVTVGGCLEWKVPIFANTLQDCWYAINYDDPDVKTAKTDYPWIAKSIKSGQVCLNENAYERIARLAVVQSSQNRTQDWNIGDSLSHLISRGNGWLRLSAFESMKDSFQGPDGAEMVEGQDRDGNPIERDKTVREKIAELYPNGVHVVVIGSEYAESWDESIDDKLTVFHAYIGKGQNRKSLMREMVLVQDGFNQTVNYIREKNDFGVPSTWVNSDACDYAAITKQSARPGAFREMKNLKEGADIRQYVYRETEDGIPPNFMQFLDFLQNGLPQFQLSCPPSVWGQAMSDNKTAEGYQFAAAQAMGILGKLRTRVISGVARIYYQACLAVSRDERYAEQITVPIRGQKGRTTTVRKNSLAKGNFRTFPDKDSGFPESTQQTRQSLERFATLIAPTPLAGQIWSSPENVAEIVRVQGLRIVVPEAESWSKQSREIEILLRQPPVFGKPELAQLLADGAGVQAMIDAIKAAVAQAQAEAVAAAQAATNTAMVEHAAQTLIAHANGGQELPAPPPVQPVPVDPSTIARSSVPVWDSDYHVYEANKCQNFLNSTDCYTELTVGRTSTVAEDGGALRPNIGGILNVALHRLEHLLKSPAQPMPQTGPLPAVGSAPKLPAAAPSV